MTLTQRLSAYERLLRLDKPIGILLLLWPTLWGLWMASDGHPNAIFVWIFVLGTVLMRSAGCAINDWADRDIDGRVARTRNRPIPSGEVSPAEAVGLAAGLALAALLLAINLPKPTWWLVGLAAFLAASYPFTKRFFALPQAYLGIAFGMGIPMAFATFQGQVPLVGWLLLLANVFWAIAYDTAYAMVDREDDKKIGIKTAAITFGRFDVVAIMICYALMLLLLAGIGYHLKMSVHYYFGLLAALGIVNYFYTQLRTRDPQRCFKVFLANNWVGAVIFAGIVANYYFSMTVYIYKGIVR